MFNLQGAMQGWMGLGLSGAGFGGRPALPGPQHSSSVSVHALLGPVHILQRLLWPLFTFFHPLAGSNIFTSGWLTGLTYLPYLCSWGPYFSTY